MFATACTRDLIPAMQDRVVAQCDCVVRHAAPAVRRTATAITTAACHALQAVAGHAADGLIDLSADVRIDFRQSAPVSDRPVRIGIYPLSADPLHWGHILIGLQAAARLQLDRVVYLVAGYDPRKPLMSGIGVRHAIARATLQGFAPLLSYSPLSLHTHQDGETNMFTLLRMNPGRSVHAWYLVGDDHFRRYYPGGQFPDTVQKLETCIGCGMLNGLPHRISVAFIQRATAVEPISTMLDWRVLPRLPVAVSSTIVREAFAAGRSEDVRALIPAAVYSHLSACGLYRSHRRRAGSRTSAVA